MKVASLFVCGLVLFGLLWLVDFARVVSAEPPTAGDEFWNDEFFVGGPSDAVTMLGWYQDELIVGGDFRTAGKAVVNHLAKWNGAEWESVGDAPFAPVCAYRCTMFGLSLHVNAFAVYDNELVVGGTFQKNIASWNGTRWEFLGGGLTGSNGYMSAMGSVATLAVMGNDLFIGGSFDNPGTGELTQLLRWDGTNWSDVNRSRSGSLGAYVAALVAHGDDLYVAGGFSDFGGIPAKGIAKWNRVTNQWSALGDSNADMYWIQDMIWYEDKLLIATGNQIQAWDGTQWREFNDSANTKGQIFDLAVHDNDLYVVGELETMNGVAVNNIAIWNGATWRGLDQPIHGAVNTIYFQNDAMYIGGAFDRIGDMQALNVAKWGGAQWHSLQTPGAQGIVGDVYAMARDGTDVYVGGDFSWVGEKRANGLAKWDSMAHTWTPLGNVDCDDDACRARVFALAHDGKALYVGGQFNEIGGTQAQNLAKWNGKKWSALGEWDKCCVNALAVKNDFVYVSDESNKVYQFDGHSWKVIGKVTSSPYYEPRVYALAFFENDLFAGGSFDNANGTAAHNIARWDGAAWHDAGTGMNDLHDSVNLLYASGKTRYAVTWGGIYWWRGNKWRELGDDSSYAYDVVRTQGKSFLSGESSEWTSVRGVGQRVDKQWQTLGSGIGLNPVNPFSWGGVARKMTTVNTQIIVGGRFDIVGGKPASNFAIWTDHAPPRPKLQAPANGAQITTPKTMLEWKDAAGSVSYQLQLRAEKQNGDVVLDIIVKTTNLKTPKLESGREYYWRVRACNDYGCSAWTKWWRFSIR